MKMNLLTELICNVLLYSIGFGGLMVVCAVAEGQLSLLPALAIGAVLCFTFNAVAGVRIALRNTNTQKRSVTIAPQPHPQSSTPPLRVMRGEHALLVDAATEAARAPPLRVMRGGHAA